MRTMKSLALFLMFLLSLAWVAGVDRVAAKSAAYQPHINPADFRPTVDNPYFPLVPGTVFKFVEKSGNDSNDNTVTVTHDTKLIMGVTCVVVHDQLTAKGVLKEETLDWYAQDKAGNVWYFGEATKEFGDHGQESTEGSWEAGVNGAQPGIIMKARPAVGERYRQEYLKGQAEDMAQVVAVNESVTVPFGAFTGCLMTKDWSMLTSGTEKKWYAKGIGPVREESATKEIAALISVTRP